MVHFLAFDDIACAEFITAQCYASTVHSVVGICCCRLSVCLSVHPSVTSRHCI